MRFTKVILFVFLSLLFLGQRAVAEDENEQCGEWAAMGECDANPGYMLSHCADACAEVAASTGASPPLPESFYDIAEQDLDGNDLLMSEFRGKVVYIVNVASHCGYTKENYDMFRKLAKYRSKGLEMVLAPCNQFGQQGKLFKPAEEGVVGRVSVFNRGPWAWRGCGPNVVGGPRV